MSCIPSILVSAALMNGCAGGNLPANVQNILNNALTNDKVCSVNYINGCGNVGEILKNLGININDCVDCDDNTDCVDCEDDADCADCEKTPAVTQAPKPTAAPTAAPVAKPTAAPTAKPTAAPTAAPTAKPAAAPTAKPTAAPTAAPTAKPTAAPAATGQSENDYARQVVALVNQERAKQGLGALTIDEKLMAAAQKRAVETVTSFAHTRPNGTSFSTVLSEYGVSYRTAGENIAYGQRTPEAVMEAWMNSSGHRANILNGSYTKIGVGCYKVGNTYYWSQEFIG